MISFQIWAFRIYISPYMLTYTLQANYIITLLHIGSHFQLHVHVTGSSGSLCIVQAFGKFIQYID